jgi:hypothetical protein
MPRLGSTALAALCALAVVEFSGHLASANAEPINPPAAKVYADSTGVSTRPAITSVQAAEAIPNERNSSGSASISGGTTSCDLRCRTGFFGYR